MLDIEIKTANFPARDLVENLIVPTCLLNDNGRKLLSDFCSTNGINCHIPRIKKIKDYMNYAGDKFAEISSESHINLLVINWTSTNLPETGFTRLGEDLGNCHACCLNNFGVGIHKFTAKTLCQSATDC